MDPLKPRPTLIWLRSGDAALYTALWRPTEVAARRKGSPGDDLSHLGGGEQASAISRTLAGGLDQLDCCYW